MKKTLIPITIIAIFIGCAGSKMLVPTQADADRAKDKFPNITVADLSEGKILYEEKCTTCHGLYKPNSQSTEAWNRIVPEMTRKANKNTTKIEPKQEKLILQYLVTMGEVPK